MAQEEVTHRCWRDVVREMNAPYRTEEVICVRCGQLLRVTWAAWDRRPSFTCNRCGYRYAVLSQFDEDFRMGADSSTGSCP